MGILQGFFLKDPRVRAFGGTVIDADGYRIHVFTGTGPFNVLSSGEVEYLVVAGGGGGGANSYPGPLGPRSSGGGGAGGLELELIFR